jgi:hypothetical protein
MCSATPSVKRLASGVRAFGGFYEDGEGARPFFHPVHGHAAEEGGLGALVESGGFRVVGDEMAGFALVEGVEFFAVDGGQFCHYVALGFTLRSFGHPRRMASG